MRPHLLLWVCFVVAVAFVVESANGDFDDMIDIDEQSPHQNVRRTRAVDSRDQGDDDEDDDDESSGVVSDSADVSGSGSGEVDVSTVTPSTTETTETVTTEQSTTTTPATEAVETTTETDNVIPEDKTNAPAPVSQPSETEEPEPTEDNGIDPIEGENEGENDAVAGGGVGEDSTEKTPNAEARVQDKVLKVLTTEVIAAVVVGAVCAIILIAFLVYRLRKRDEGSYALSDAGYKDTYKLQGDTGKEAFV